MGRLETTGLSDDLLRAPGLLPLTPSRHSPSTQALTTGFHHS